MAISRNTVWKSFTYGDVLFRWWNLVPISITNIASILFETSLGESSLVFASLAKSSQVFASLAKSSLVFASLR